VTVGSIRRPDLFFWADRLLTCAAASLDANTEAGAPDRKAVVTGSELVWDQCECGLLAVLTPRIFLSDSFPVVKQAGPFNRCHGAIWTVVQYQVSILRCVAQPEGTAEAPLASAMTQDSMIDLEDRWAVRRGVECCLAAEAEAHPGTAPLYLLGEQLALGEGGKCAGSQLEVLVALKNCEPCGPEAEPWAIGA
jgi:hypothetical protein